MIVKLNTRTLRTVEQVRAFLAGTASVGFELPAESGRYAWIVDILRQFGYARLKRRDKGLLRRFLLKVSGYSRAQLNRLIAQWCETRALADRRGPPAVPFVTRYTDADIRLLVELDELHATLSGLAMKKLAERAYTVFSQGQYARLAGISVAHLYNLRHTQGYLRRRATVVKTRSVSIPIGERRKPQPNGNPGYLRVDSVHQGDWNGVKGVYLINFPETILDAKGRQTKRYPYARIMTPYDKLKSLPNAERYLKSGLSFEILDLQAYAVSDNAAAASLNEQRRKLFARIHSQPRAA